MHVKLPILGHSSFTREHVPLYTHQGAKMHGTLPLYGEKSYNPAPRSSVWLFLDTPGVAYGLSVAGMATTLGTNHKHLIRRGLMQKN